ncbi:preprotein translocase subunit SecY [Candidatus Woesebacteria bacterium]|nr:preprotein translocase subunit SecY [Candidatus Woesebacteria bacterium]
MLASILNFFSRALKVPDIRRKIVITGAVLFFFRLIAHIPAAGIDTASLKSLFAGSPLLTLLDVFSGGTLANFSVMALGLGPYINASIIIQLLTYVVPALEEISKEGEYGQEKLNQYTRFLTVPLSALQSLAMYLLLRNQGVIGDFTPIAISGLIITMTAGTMIAVWFGELITQYGVSNGISFLIFAGIVARLPVTLGQSTQVAGGGDLLKVGVFGILSIVIIGVIVGMNEAVRQIPIRYARRTSALGGSGYLPLRLNQAGVIPIIFAVSLVFLPSFVSQFLQGSGNAQLANIGSLLQGMFNPQSIGYNVVYFLLVFAFTYFYTGVVFNPQKISENLQKSGAFIPGMRPGKQTANYLKYILNRITLVGAVFLGAIAILPSLFQSVIGISTLAIGGTSVLIVVSVVLEFTREIEAQLVTRRYDSFIR